MKKFKVKFFGSKERRQQINQIKMIVEAESKDRVEDLLRHRYGYEIINGLKIREITPEE